MSAASVLRQEQVERGQNVVLGVLCQHLSQPRDGVRIDACWRHPIRSTKRGRVFHSAGWEASRSQARRKVVSEIGNGISSFEELFLGLAPARLRSRTKRFVRSPLRASRGDVCSELFAFGTERLRLMLPCGSAVRSGRRKQRRCRFSTKCRLSIRLTCRWSCSRAAEREDEENRCF